MRHPVGLMCIDTRVVHGVAQTTEPEMHGIIEGSKVRPQATGLLDHERTGPDTTDGGENSVISRFI